MVISLRLDEISMGICWTRFYDGREAILALIYSLCFDSNLRYLMPVFGGLPHQQQKLQAIAAATMYARHYCLGEQLIFKQVQFSHYNLTIDIYPVFFSLFHYFDKRSICLKKTSGGCWRFHLHRFRRFLSILLVEYSADTEKMLVYLSLTTYIILCNIFWAILCFY